MTRCILIKHPKNSGIFVFGVPNGKVLHKDDLVLCDTRFGTEFGKCVSEPIEVDKETMEVICEISGATLPLNNIVAKLTVEDF